MEADEGPHPGAWLAGRFTPREVDWMIVALAGVAALSGLLRVSPTGRPVVSQVLLGGLVLGLSTTPLLWRRTHPGPVLIATAVAFALVIPDGADPVPAGVALVFSVYAGALYGGRRVRLASGVTAVIVLVLSFAGAIADPPLEGGHLAGFTFGYGVAWIAGDRMRNHRAYLEALRERARRLEYERDEQAQRAAEHERLRIARELHDVVAHDVSVIAVQAGAARVTAEAEPARAVETLTLIERTARGTLSELRAVLGLLRKGDGPLRNPQPTLGEMQQLVDQARAAGIRVTTSVDGTVRPLPAVADLCAFRLVQEALTNVIRHAPGAHAHVLTRYAPAELRITVVDDGPGGAVNGAGGRGLIGMRERVALLGGTLSAGPAAGGGFRVEARLPLDAAEAGAPPPVAALAHDDR